MAPLSGALQPLARLLRSLRIWSLALQLIAGL